MGGKANNKALRRTVDELLQRAIREHNYREIARLAKIAEEASALEEQQRQIAERQENLLLLLQRNAEGAKSDDTTTYKLSARERGNRVRKVYIEALAREGAKLQRVETKKYCTTKGLAVGIPYAKELRIRAASWFLGLADEHFDFVILLCEHADTEEIVAFVFPPDVVRRIWKGLSRSQGQVKFHVTRTASTYELRLPGSQRLSINQYINATQQLKGV